MDWNSYPLSSCYGVMISEIDVRIILRNNSNGYYTRICRGGEVKRKSISNIAGYRKRTVRGCQHFGDGKIEVGDWIEYWQVVAIIAMTVRAPASRDATILTQNP